MTNANKAAARAAAAAEAVRAGDAAAAAAGADAVANGGTGGTGSAAAESAGEDDEDGAGQAVMAAKRGVGPRAFLLNLFGLSYGLEPAFNAEALPGAPGGGAVTATQGGPGRPSTESLSGAASVAAGGAAPRARLQSGSGAGPAKPMARASLDGAMAAARESGEKRQRRPSLVGGFLLRLFMCYTLWLLVMVGPPLACSLPLLNRSHNPS